MKPKLTKPILFGAPLFLWVFLAIAGFSMLHKLGEHPIYLTDESRVAINSTEMQDSGSVIIATFQGLNELWNTKPPFLLWCQAGSMKLFGVNEFALRLPSALAGLGLFLLIVWWFRSWNSNKMSPIVPAVLLLLSPGFNGWHCLRSGDYDAMLLLFLTAQLLLLNAYLNAESTQRIRLLWFLFLAIVLAVWTKGIAGLFFTPIIALWLLFNKMWRWHSTKQMVWAGCFLLLGTTSYYIIQEILQPGYFQIVMQNELNGRFIQNLEGLNTDPRLYLKLTPDRQGPLLWVFPLALITALIVGTAKARKQLLFFASFLVFYLIVIHSSKAKVPHYDLPIFPIMAIMVGISIDSLLGASRKIRVTKTANAFLAMLSMAALAMVLAPQFHKNNSGLPWDCSFEHCQTAHYLQHKLYDSKPDEFILFEKGYHADHWWYIDRFKERGDSVMIASEFQTLANMMAKGGGIHGREIVVDPTANSEELRTLGQIELVDSVSSIKNVKLMPYPLFSSF